MWDGGSILFCWFMNINFWLNIDLNCDQLKKSRSENNRDEYADRKISFSPFRGKGFIKSKKKSASSKPPLGPDWPSANASPLFSTDASQTSSLSSLSARSSPARSETESIAGCDHFHPTTKRRAIKKCSYIVEICVLLMCLAALIWGKVFAVVACTSAWLFIAPGGKPRRAESYEIGDSEEWRKRVIMEGLLEKDRSRVFQYWKYSGWTNWKLKNVCVMCFLFVSLFTLLWRKRYY